MQHLILHHHIFKNAGSTLDYSLSAQFGPLFMHFEDEGNPIHEIKLIEFLDRHPRLRAISSHNFHGAAFEPALRAQGYRAFNMAMVRRPFNRLLSMYKFFRRISLSSDLVRLAVQSDFASFVGQLIRQFPHMIDNPQVNTLGNYGFYERPVGNDELKRAWARYKRFSLCAPVERYDEAMIVLEYFNSPVYAPDGLNMAYVRQNVSEHHPGEDDMLNMIGREAHSWLTRLHRFDEHLWILANAELNRRISLVPEFNRRLADFRDRCLHLNGSVV